jgi:hypothetical protein
MLPITNDGYRYLLTVIDIWSNYIDFEPLKTKTAKETLAAIKTIFNRKYVSEARASIKTDSGREFLESFDQYFKKQKIAHLINLPDRHSQMAKIENLNKQIARLIMTYLTEKTMENGEQYREWTDVLDIIRKGLNEIKTHPKDEDPYKYPMPEPKIQALPRYKTGDIVYRSLEKPQEYGTKFRSGDNRYDMVPRKVKNVYLYDNNWRYRLVDFPNVAYAEAKLKPAAEEEERYEVKKIIGKRSVNKIVQYLVWWKKQKKAESTWEDRSSLLEDGLEEYIEEYEEEAKKPKKKTPNPSNVPRKRGRPRKTDIVPKKRGRPRKEH